MGTLDESGPIGFKEAPDDEIHFTMRILFSEKDVSPAGSNSFPNNSGSTSPNLP